MLLKIKYLDGKLIINQKGGWEMVGSIAIKISHVC